MTAIAVVIVAVVTGGSALARSKQLSGTAGYL
jgi:hypothetical protein